MKRFLLFCLIISAVILNFASVSLAKSEYNVRNSFLDEKTNSKFFVLEGNIVLFETNDGNWFRLGEKVPSFYKDPDLSHPSIGYIKGYPFDYSQFYFDVSKKNIYKGNQYYKSPNNKWGYINKRYSISKKVEGGWQSWNVHSIFLKNMENGEIEEILESNKSVFVKWTKDNKLLICRYSNKERQKEILIYKPEEKTLKQLTLGSLYYFLPEKNLVLFAKNEPQRKPWILTVNDGKERLVTDHKEVENIYKQSSNYKKLELPTDFEIESVKILNPSIETKFEYNLEIENKVIPVSFIFKKGNKTYLPIRPLMEGLNLQVECLNPDQTNYKYKVTYGDKSIVLSNQNSIIYLWRLYVTEKELEDLGIQNINITQFL